MRYLLLGLLLAVAPALAAPVTITLTGEDCGAWRVTRAGPTSVCVDPIIPPQPPSGWPVVCHGYEGRTLTRQVVVPASGFTKYVIDNFKRGSVLVVRFVAPSADPAWQINWVQTGGMYGPAATRLTVLSSKPCDFAYPRSADAIYADRAAGFSLNLATMESIYTRYQLQPGRTYYLNVSNADCPTERCDISLATANNRP